MEATTVKTLITVIVLLFPVTEANEFMTVRKCCGKGKELDPKLRTCVLKPGWKEIDVKSEILTQPFIETDAYWLPQWLRSKNVSLSVEYNTRSLCQIFPCSSLPFEEAADEVVGRIFNMQKNASLELDSFNAQQQIFLVTDQEFCFDTTVKSQSPVVITWITFPLPKCCRKDERVDPATQKCQSSPHTAANNEYEVLNTINNPSTASWLPKRILPGALGVLYNRGPSEQWNVLVNPDETSWILKYYRGEGRLHINAKTEKKHIVGVTRRYCFDVATYGDKKKHVLLALLTTFTKCCKKGEMLDRTLTDCVEQTGLKTEHTRFEEVDPIANPKAANWLPETSRNRKISVQYGHNWFGYDTYAFPAENYTEWNIRSSDAEETTLNYFLRTASGTAINLTTTDFCFDSVNKISHSSPFLVASLPPRHANITKIDKCCSNLQILSSDGRCVKTDEYNWNPYNSSITRYLESSQVYLRDIFIMYLCSSSTYRNIEPLRVRDFDKMPCEKDDYSSTCPCVDWQRMNNGSMREVSASCMWPTSAPLYKKVRPLHVVAAALLAMSLAAILCRHETRNSTHGQALACHAACLMFANVLQAAWFFTHKKTENHLYAYSIYFFLIAGAFWLSAVAVNMARGFRRPLGALAGSIRDKRLRFSLLSLYAWGFPVALTALAVSVHQNRGSPSLRGHITPTFFETRTHTIERIVTLSYQTDTVKSAGMLGSLVYYYVPCAILVLGNAVCLVMTLCRVRDLRKETAFLQSTSRPLRSALLYVKLLLTAGVVELVAEGAVWGSRQRRFYGHLYFSFDHARETAYLFAIVGTFIDLARAIGVLVLCVKWRWVSAACTRLRLRSPESSTPAISIVPLRDKGGRSENAGKEGRISDSDNSISTAVSMQSKGSHDSNCEVSRF